MELSENLFIDTKRYTDTLIEEKRIPAINRAIVSELFLAGGNHSAVDYFQRKDVQPQIIFGDTLITKEDTFQQAYYELETWEKLSCNPSFSDKVWLAALLTRLEELKSVGYLLIDAQTYTLVNLLQQNDRREIARVSRTLDCLYFDENLPEGDPTFSRFGVPERNAATAEKFYNILQEKDIPVERFSLFDFTFTDQKRNQQYKKEIERKATRLKNN